MKQLVLVLLLALFAPSALACQFNTDCAVGSKCVKKKHALDGYCAGGISPGNKNDQKPYRDPLDLSDSVGNTCQFNTDCGVGAKCAKQSGRLEGVCVKSR